jgi:hypothetical protein
MSTQRDIAEVHRRMVALGPLPAALVATDWCLFGDRLAKDINLSALTYNNKPLRTTIKEMGGVAAIWRELFQTQCPETLNRALVQYGYPSANYRCCSHHVNPFMVQDSSRGQHMHRDATPYHAAGPEQACSAPARGRSRSGPPHVQIRSQVPTIHPEIRGEVHSDRPNANGTNVRGRSVSSARSDYTGHRSDSSSSRSHSSPVTKASGRSRTPLQRRRVPCKPAFTDVWLIAGDEALHPGFLRSLEKKSEELGWVVDRVKLPVNVVVHTGVALAQVLFCMDAGACNINTAPDFDLHCIVSECCLKKWPVSNQAAFKNRLDNINHCLRAFGVDGGSTRALENDKSMQISGEALIRSSLNRFMILGDGPIGVIKIPVYRRRLQWLQKRALADDNLVEEIVYAGLQSPDEARNGIQLWTDRGNEIEAMYKQIATTSGTGANVLLLVLDPSGRNLLRQP